jgi:aminoglycoside phosphotransferase (APT) family kinase protein
VLERSIRLSGPHYAGFRLRGCVPSVVRHKPGSRCTILYRLQYPEGTAREGWPDSVVAKAYSDDKGRTAWDGMQALWHSPMASSGVAIPEPFAYLADSRVLVQGPVGGQRTVKDSIRAVLGAGDNARAELSGQLRGTASGLAALHRCGVTYGDVVTWEDELADVRRLVDGIAARVPWVAAVAEPVLAALTSTAARTVTDPTRPAHGSFRPDQVLIDGQSIGFIDFDGFSQAEPARDLALFRTTVSQLGSMPAHVEALDQMAAEFFAAYTRELSVSPLRVALWEALHLLTRVLHCWTKVKPEKAGAAMAALEHHLAAEPLDLRI